MSSKKPTLSSFASGHHTMEDVFKYTRKKVLKQGRASMNDFGNCAYRGKKGAKCVIGHILSDKQFEKASKLCPGVNDDPVGALVYTLKMKISGPKLAFIKELQRAHDVCQGLKGKEFKKNFKDSMKEFKKKYID